jgi:hypothetical protein
MHLTRPCGARGVARHSPDRCYRRDLLSSVTPWALAFVGYVLVAMVRDASRNVPVSVQAPPESQRSLNARDSLR